MSSYVVRHLPEDLGDVTTVFKQIKKVPFSYTSKNHEAEMASHGEFIYVVQREKVGREVVYKLAYRYRCTAVHRMAGSGKWLDIFEFKNTVEYGEDGQLKLLDPPEVITDDAFNIWYKTKTLGMCELPEPQEEILKSILR
jgi:hypothetical protein